MEENKKKYPGYEDENKDLRATNEARKNSPENYQDAGMDADDLRNQSTRSDWSESNKRVEQGKDWSAAPDDLNTERRDRTETEWNDRSTGGASREDARLGNQPSHGWDETRKDITSSTDSTDRLGDRPGSNIAGGGYNPGMSNETQQNRYSEVTRDASREAYDEKNREGTNPVGMNTSSHTEFVAGNTGKPEIFYSRFTIYCSRFTIENLCFINHLSRRRVG